MQTVVIESPAEGLFATRSSIDSLNRFSLRVAFQGSPRSPIGGEYAMHTVVCIPPKFMGQVLTLDCSRFLRIFEIFDRSKLLGVFASL